MHARTTVTVPRVDGLPDVHHGAPCPAWASCGDMAS